MIAKTNEKQNSSWRSFWRGFTQAFAPLDSTYDYSHEEIVESVNRQYDAERSDWVVVGDYLRNAMIQLQKEHRELN